MDIAEEPEGGISERGYGLRGVASAECGGVFAEDGVSDPVEPVLDAPMSSV